MNFTLYTTAAGTILQLQSVFTFVVVLNDHAGPCLEKCGIKFSSYEFRNDRIRLVKMKKCIVNPAPNIVNVIVALWLNVLQSP